MTAQRILVVCPEIPYPPNSGGRVDVWRHLKSLRALGASIQLITWYDRPREGEPTPEQLRELKAVCDDVLLLPITRSPRELFLRALYIGRLPSHAASRWVTAPLKDLEGAIKKYAADAVLLHGLYGAAIGQWAARILDRPIFYRSHNIEYQYMRKQLLRAKGLKSRFGLFANLVALRSFEVKTISRAKLVFDISLDDMQFWRNKGFENFLWLPTGVDEAFARSLSVATEAVWDVLYFGNLRTPNNVEAIEWFVDQVLPLSKGSEIRIAFAGSNPSARLFDIARRDARISVLENPADMALVVSKARVLINPVLAGSGVNLKSVEMLFSRSALVSTEVGVQGMPAQAKNCFTICNTAEQFSLAIKNALASEVDQDLDSERERARAFFRSLTVGGTLLSALTLGAH